jgi:hypothetical protein
MGENTGQIEHEIASHRRELGRNLSELEEKAKSLTDCREYYRANPGLFLGAALAGGLLLGTLAGSSSGPSFPRLVDEREPRPLGLRSRAGQKAGDTWQHVSDILMDLASAKVVEFVSSMVPGFEERYRSQYRDQYQGNYQGNASAR